MSQTVPYLTVGRNIRSCVCTSAGENAIWKFYVSVTEDHLKVSVFTFLSSFTLDWISKERSMESSNYVLFVWFKARLSTITIVYLQIFAYTSVQTVFNENWESSKTFYFQMWITLPKNMFTQYQHLSTWKRCTNNVAQTLEVSEGTISSCYEF